LHCHTCIILAQQIYAMKIIKDHTEHFAPITCTGIPVLRSRSRNDMPHRFRLRTWCLTQAPVDFKKVTICNSYLVFFLFTCMYAYHTVPVPVV
jgi:hypothetical protein